MDEKDLTARVGEPDPPMPPSKPGRFFRLGARGLAGLITVIYWIFTLLLAVNFPMIGIGLMALGLFFALSKKTRWAESEGLEWFRLIAAVTVFLLMIGMSLYMRYVDDIVVPTREYHESGGAGFGITKGERRFLRPPDEPSALSLPSAEAPRIDGATSLSPLYTLMASYVFSREWQDARVPGRLSVSTTPMAYDRLIADEADLIFVFPPSEEQENSARAAGRSLTVTPIGREAFVFFVNNENPTEGLSVQQLRDIYAGRVRRWSEVGGKNARIVPFQRAKNSGSQSRMERFMDGDRLEEPRTEWRVASMSGIVERVARYRNYRDALGFSFLYYIENMVDAHGLKLLAIDGVRPTTDSIRDGTYSLTDTLCVVTAGEPSPTVTAFIEWILSPQGQRMVELGGYTPIRKAD